MLTAITIILRVTLVAALLTAYVAPQFIAMSSIARRVGIATAIAAVAILLGLRIGMRVVTPEKLPSFSG